MGKRLAEKQLNINDVINDSDQENQSQSENEEQEQVDQTKFAQRKILKIIRPHQQRKEEKIEEKSPSTVETQDKQPIEEQPIQKPIAEEAVQPKVQAEIVSETESKVPQEGQIKVSQPVEIPSPEQKEKPAQNSLFGNKFGTSNIFGGGAPSMSLGSNAFGSSAPVQGGIFGALGGQSTSVFGKAPTNGFFGTSQQPVSSIFSNIGVPASSGGSIFNQTNSIFGGGNNVFQFPQTGKQQDQASDGEDDNEQDEEGKGGDSPAAYQPLSIQSQPIEKSPYTKIYNNIVEKFKLLPSTVKKDANLKAKSMGKGHMSIEFANLNNNKVYICVFRNLIGKSLYQGTISAQFSKKRRIVEKANKQQLKVALVTKNLSSKKLQVDYVVISFSRSDELNQFENVFEEAMNELKEQLTTA